MTSSSRIVTVAVALTAAIIAPVQGFAPPLHTTPVRTTTTTTTTSSLAMMDPAMIGTFYHDEPFLAAFLTCSVKGCLADGVAQQSQQSSSSSLEPNKSSFDVSRNLAFILYGGLYQGMGQSFLFSHVYPHLFGTDHTWTTVASQVLTDLFVVGPFFCLPTAYTIKASLASESPLDLETNMATGVQNYMADIMGDEKLLWKYWSLWIPVQSLTFGVVPEHLRVPFVAMVSFFWVMMLSSVSSSSSNTAAAAAKATLTKKDNAAAFVPPSVMSTPSWPEKQWVSS